MAERILTFQQVSGIGPKKFERMKPFVRVK
jgi:hypothetical protein